MATTSNRNKIPSPKELNNTKLGQLIAQPKYAWPTLILFVVSLSIWLTSTLAGANGLLPNWLAISISAISAYWLFTVLHDSTHRAISNNTRLNDWLGQISLLPLLPIPLYKMFRFVHMQHHRFTNEETEKDPDSYTSSGPTWQLPLRWFTLDFSYFAYYLPKLKQRPKEEQRELVYGLVVFAAMMVLFTWNGWMDEFLLYWFLPSRFAVFFLALAFDYLPHMPKKATQQEDPFQATNNRMGHEWLLTPILLWQNYHLVHHLYPRAPFYRYIKIWRSAEQDFRSRGALLVDWKSKEISD